MSLRVYCHFMRPFTLVPPVLGMLSGCLIALGATTDRPLLCTEPATVIVKIVMGGLVAALLNGASNGLNQIFDVQIDRINKPHRPLSKGDMSFKEAWIITLLCYLFALILAWNINATCFWIVTTAAMCTIAYSVPPVRTKRFWLCANFTIAFPRGLLLKVAGWSVLRDIDILEPWYLGAIFGFFLLGATTTKDYADMKGDGMANCITLPMRFGVKTSIWMITPFLILPFWAIPVGLYAGILSGNPLLLWILTISLSLWGVYLVKLLLANPESLLRSENHPSWTQMYLMMMYAQIGLALAYIIHVK